MITQTSYQHPKQQRQSSIGFKFLKQIFLLPIVLFFIVELSLTVRQEDFRRVPLYPCLATLGTFSSFKNARNNRAESVGLFGEFLFLKFVSASQASSSSTSPDVYSILYGLYSLSKDGHLQSELSIYADPCDWTGVTCIGGSSSGERVITAISLPGKKLFGTLPTNLSLLSNITTLSITDNDEDLGGMLSPSWGSDGAAWKDTLKHLDLHGNRLSGSLPSSWSGLSILEYLNLDDNQISGTLPLSWAQGMQSLQQLWIRTNKLIGVLPDGWSLGFPSLEIMRLTWNQLSGTLPSSWSAMKKVNYFHLAGNPLSGTLPSSWGQSNSIAKLSLYFCNFSGPLPEAWGEMKNFFYFNAFHNGFTGTLPKAWGKLTGFQYVSLSRNSISGPLPESWGNTSLNVVRLEENLLNGTLPENWRKLVNMSFLDLRFNALVGTLPSAWGAMSARRMSSNKGSNENNEMTIVLDGNRLSGVFPETWFNASLSSISCTDNRLSGIGKLAPSVEGLRLRGNQLHGEVPCPSSTSLKILDLSFNYLNGTFPSCLMQATQLQVLDLSGNAIGGDIPSLAHLGQLQQLRLSDNNFTSLPPEWPGNMTVFFAARNAPIVADLPWDLLTVSPRLCQVDLSGNSITAQFYNDIHSTHLISQWLGLSILDLEGNELLGGPISFNNYIPRAECATPGRAIYFNILSHSPVFEGFHFNSSEQLDGSEGGSYTRWLVRRQAEQTSYLTGVADLQNGYREAVSCAEICLPSTLMFVEDVEVDKRDEIGPLAISTIRELNNFEYWDMDSCACPIRTPEQYVTDRYQGTVRFTLMYSPF